MKYAVIIPDGAADLPLEAFGGRTVLEAADLPHCHALAARGELGLARTVPPGMTPGSDVAIMSVLGYDPRAGYTGRAPIEAVARGIAMEPHDVVFRCNLVTVADGIMDDFSAGHIESAEGAALMAALNEVLAEDGVRFHPGVSYRNLMVTAPAAAYEGLETTPPHDILGQPIDAYRPHGPGAERVGILAERARAVLAMHPVNAGRKRRGQKPATDIWLWGHGRRPELTPFRVAYGRSGAMISAVDLGRGLGRLLGWELIDVPGATGYLDTNYRGKGEAACAALDRADVVTVHVEAPDEAGHNGDPVAKKLALERIDEYIVGPIIRRLEGFGGWRVLLMPDHPTPIRVRSHTPEPVPFVRAGSDVPANGAGRFTEAEAAQTGLVVDPGWRLMERLLRG